jgi:hypothetical protein
VCLQSQYQSYLRPSFTTFMAYTFNLIPLFSYTLPQRTLPDVSSVFQSRILGKVYITSHFHRQDLNILTDWPNDVSYRTCVHPCPAAGTSRLEEAAKGATVSTTCISLRSECKEERNTQTWIIHVRTPGCLVTVRQPATSCQDIRPCEVFIQRTLVCFLLAHR